MKSFHVWRLLLCVMAALLLSAGSALAATDGYYQARATEEADWDGTSANRFLPEEDGTYQFDYGDDALVTFTLPWPFTYYGTNYSQLKADANGNIWFGTVGSGPVLRAWNTDLNSYYQGGVFVESKTSPGETSPDRVVVEWRSETTPARDGSTTLPSCSLPMAISASTTATSTLSLPVMPAAAPFMAMAFTPST